MKPEPKLEFEMVAKDSCRLWCWLELLKGFEHDLVGPCYRLQALLPKSVLIKSDLHLASQLVFLLRL